MTHILLNRKSDQRSNTPLAFDQSMIDMTSFCDVALQFFLATFALTPTVPEFALCPHKNAVAVPAESGTCASEL